MVGDKGRYMACIHKWIQLTYRLNRIEDQIRPHFSSEELEAFTGSTLKMKLIILGGESASLLHIHQVVEHVEYTFCFTEELEWEFVKVTHSREDEMVAILYVA